MAADLDLPYTTVQSWGERGIPARRYLDIIGAARKRGYELSFEALDAISEALRGRDAA